MRGLPRPEPQVEIYDDEGAFLARGDLVVASIRFLAEYDGERWHGEEQRAHDDERRRRLRDAGWTVQVVTRDNVFGHGQDAIRLLREGVTTARERMPTWNIERA